MRRFAISDIHGCLNTFKTLLQRLEFSKKDVLYLLGDYIDRGPDSRGVIDYIWALEEEGYTLHCLRGNHEQMLLDDRYGMFGYTETLASFQVRQNKDVPAPYMEWIDTLPFYVELEDYILVHAGINFRSRFPLKDQYELIWIRYWYEGIDKNWLNGKIVVHGHTPTHPIAIKMSLKELKEIPAIGIDAGCAFKSSGLGNLCAINLDTKALIFQPCADY